MRLRDQSCEGPSPAQLVLGARGGDAAAWEALIRRYRLMVDAIARCYTMPPQDAEDAKQLVWCLLAEHIDRIRRPAAIGGWIARTAHDACLKQAVLARRFAPVDPASLPVVASDDPEAACLGAERDRRVRAAVRGMYGPGRVLITLDLYFPRTSDTEAADFSGLPLAEVKSARKRARRLLRRLLMEDPGAFGALALDSRPPAPEWRPRHDR